MGPKYILLVVLPSQIFGFTSHRTRRAGRECDHVEESCVLKESCQGWCDQLRLFGISSQNTRQLLNDKLCGFQGRDAKVCCKKEKVTQKISCDTPPTPQTQPLLTPPRTPQRPSQPECGIPGDIQDTRVANGVPVPSPGAWPWMARLIYSANEKSPAKTFCGGALVSSRHIITAAHCIQDDKIGKPIAVVLGDVDVTTEYDCVDTNDECGADGRQGLECYNNGWCAKPAVKYNVKRITVAPAYNKTGGGEGFGGRFPINDIAVIELEQEVTFTNLIRPACLPTSEKAFDYPSSPMVLKGWGNEVAGLGAPSSSSILQMLPGLRETPLEDTKDLNGCKTLLGLPLLDSQMCIEGSEDSEVNSNACQGDSGGPVSLLHRGNKGEAGHWQLVGVISFGSGRCGSRTPLVVTRVGEPATLAWVKQIIGDNGL